MKTILKVACATALAVGANDASAERWTWRYDVPDSAQTQGGGHFEFDRDSVQRNGDIVMVDARLTLEKPITHEGLTVASVRSREVIDCKTSTRRSATTRFFGADGAVVMLPPDDQSQPIRPGSPFAFVQSIVCPENGQWSPVPGVHLPAHVATLEYDATSIERTGTTVAVWERVRFAKPETIGDKAMGILDSQSRYDCAASTVQDLAARIYDPEGVRLPVEDVGEAQAKAVTPTSMGGQRLKFFCGLPAR